MYIGNEYVLTQCIESMVRTYAAARRWVHRSPWSESESSGGVTWNRLLVRVIFNSIRILGNSK